MANPKSTTEPESRNTASEPSDRSVGIGFANEHWNAENVLAHLAAAQARGSERWTRRVLKHLRANVNAPNAARTGSPIDAIFETWWYHCLWSSWICGPDFLMLRRQVPVTAGDRNCRLDFVIEPGEIVVTEIGMAFGIPIPRVGVELDGHEFHERTREQVADRNERDRALQSAGWVIFHFSGSEIHRWPERCVEEVHDRASALVGDFHVRVFERALKFARAGGVNA